MSHPATAPTAGAHTLWLLTKYYATRVRKQAIMYACVSMVFAILLTVNISERADAALCVIVFTVLPYLFAFSPIIFAKGGDTRPIERMIPARPAEKFWLQTGYLLVVVPLLVYTLPLLAMAARTQYFGFPTPRVMEMIILRLKPDNSQFYFNIADNLAMMALAFYVVNRATRSRMLYGILAVVCYQIGCGIIGAVFGFYWAFNKGLDDGMAGQDPMPPTPTEISSIISDFQPMLATVGIASAVLAIIFLYLAYRQISRKQL